MANPYFFKEDFDALATEGAIGAPHGVIAYAYIRVSGDDQAEDGRSGLPRQLAHIHEAACRHGFRIPWELVYADDHTGFEFEDRPALAQLRREYKSSHKRAHAIVMEHLDRLSRNADWHQGFLLDEMHKHGIQTAFWKAFSSRIERAVLGAVAQEGMEHEKRRMMEGNLYKARSGRVTARVPAYGYKLVDANGNEGPAARKDSYYAIREDEAAVVRLIYEKFLAGDSLRKIAHDLEMSGIKPPKQYRHWELTQVRLFIKNEVYQGDFYAHRWEHTKMQKPDKDGLSLRTVKCKVERPREEWIHIPVPSIVSRELWEAANRLLARNQKTARRNGNMPYLLTGLVRCAHCGWKYVGNTHRPGKRAKPHWKPYRGYRCPHYSTRPKYLSEHVECENSQIPCHVLDTAVWNVVCAALLEPAMLIEALDSDATSERNQHLLEQIAYLEQEITRKEGEDEKLLRAYLAGAFDEQEYAARRRMLKTEAATMSEEMNRLRAQVITPEQLESRKTEMLALSEQIRELRIPLDPPFEVKQRILKLLVDTITLDVSEGWFTIEGKIQRGIFPIVSTPADTD